MSIAGLKRKVIKIEGNIGQEFTLGSFMRKYLEIIDGTTTGLPFGNKPKVNSKGQVVDHEIKKLERKLKKYKGQERRLMSVLRLDVVSSDVVLDEVNQMKQERERDEAMLKSLCQTRDNLSRITDMESHLKELCARIIPDLDNCTNQDKKDAYTFLDLKVSATPEGADIKGFIDSKLLTTGQTSA